ncbi:MAG: transporter substrate-binding domain-containing protein [Ruminiclostridium sp.]|nr:transporter substrate-binding domain-containing protein [Ruminiclostridium sp.]
MKNMKKILCAVLSLVMVLSMAACGGDTSAETETPSDSAASGKIAEIQEKGQLVLGTASGYPPFEFVSMENNGEVIGIDVELAQAIADKLGVELVVQDMPFGELIMNLNSGVCDIVIAGLPETPERAEMADFSMVYVNDEQTIIVRAEDADKYTSLEDFEGKTVDVELGASSEAVARAELPGATVNALSLIADCFTELSQGKCDAVVTGMVVGKQYVVNNSAYAELADIDFVNKDKPTQACIAKGAPEFLELVNEVIKENQDNGNFDKWIDQYSAQASKEAQS